MNHYQGWVKFKWLWCARVKRAILKRKKKFTKQTPKVLDWSDSSKKNFIFCIKPTPPTIISCLTSFLVKRVARLQSMEKTYYYERSNFFTLKMKRGISRCLFWIAISEKVNDCTETVVDDNEFSYFNEMHTI